MLTVKTWILRTLLSGLASVAAAAGSQAQTVDDVAGLWNSNTTGENIEIRASTADVHDSRIGQGRIAVTVEHGANFVIQYHNGSRCWYYITILPDRKLSLAARGGPDQSPDCLVGGFAWVRDAGDVVADRGRTPGGDPTAGKGGGASVTPQPGAGKANTAAPQTPPAIALLTTDVILSSLRASRTPGSLQQSLNKEARHPFKIWLEAPAEARQYIEGVEYKLDPGDSSAAVRAEAGSETFTATWLGQGCVSQADVLVRLKGGSSVGTKFDLCKLLDRK